MRLSNPLVRSPEHPDHLRHRCGFSREWGAPYIVAELLEGDELRAKLNDGAITPRKAVERSNSAGAGEHHSISDGMKLLEKHTVPRSAGMSCDMPAVQRSCKFLKWHSRIISTLR